MAGEHPAGAVALSMPLDPQAQRFLDLLSATRPPSAASSSVDERRSALAYLMQWGGRAPLLKTEDRSMIGPGGTLGLRLYTPPGLECAESAGLIYLHGGGLLAGSVLTHDPVARRLGDAGQCRVVSVDYRLAPESRFPAALEDATAATIHVAERAAQFGIDPKRLGICGDSAGGCLAAAVCQALAGAVPATLALQVLLCPILDYGRCSESRRALGSGYFLDEATLAHDLEHYLGGGADPDDPRISPLRAPSLSGLPPAIIHTAQYDPLRDEGRDYAERLAVAGCPVSYTCHPGMIHLFYALGGLIGYAHRAFEQLGAEIRAGLAPP